MRARLTRIGGDKEAVQGKILVTGAAGFIGFHLTKALLAEGADVVGADNLNPYYLPGLKEQRLAALSHPRFEFRKIDLADRSALDAMPDAEDFGLVVHLAAQAGVRYSLENPFAYADSNLVGHLATLEFVRRRRRPPTLLYASSSSVYGGNAKTPFSEADRVDQPVSLYAATKRAGELLSESYARLYGFPQIGLRFFTVYGPWGRPDMAYWTFTENILAGKPIRVFNHGNMKRDFTYIDDVVAGLTAIAQNPAKAAAHRIYNIGNNRPATLGRFIEIIEKATGRTAEKIYEPMQPGDVVSTYADIDAISADYGFKPTTPLDVGIPKFVEWYKSWRGGT